MREIYSAAELREKIRKVDAHIERALAAKETSLDTGQSRQRVLRQELEQLQNERIVLMARLDAKEKRGQRTTIRPRWS